MHATLATRILSVTLALLLAPSLIAQIPRITDNVVPGAEWQHAIPESVGYSSAMLEGLRGWVKTQDPT